ncbi:uncharacterized protein EAE97_008648 [Botrytis byssoidea]|uniref:3-phytase n=1 Tax=Botrytis byssoidea TaxID=139641 RepID=A0A9P5IHF9_9HELO|nr:uncharacterized protein EAE97_008648 [Botrytis byssoidea]KAF7934288.1 hypothetical protein EAE97_008648 [Botrytis byssoidea]
MTTLQPRGPYSQEELKKLYPDELQLQLVQVLMRHGERSPVSARFQNAGLQPYWPYCSAARRMVSATMEANSSDWTPLQWRRRLETFGNDDGPIIARGPRGEVDDVCNLGELTDKGRETTSQLGTRLRRLYIDQLGFLPQMIHNTDFLYLRATPIPRALESMQEAFFGMYPPYARAAACPPPTIITRSPSDETLFPNDSGCRRFAQLSRAFAQRTADRWNETDEMEYLNFLIGKWMPDSSKRVAVDSHPRLSGIMDTINSTLAHGPETRLPKEFYDQRGRAIIEKIGVEEWFTGYNESEEYRSLGIGGLMGDLVERMVGSVEHNGQDGLFETGGENGSTGIGRGGERAIKMGLSGCHDTTLAAVLTSLGAFDDRPWPPYTSHIALEMFRKKQPSLGEPKYELPSNSTGTGKGLLSIFGLGKKTEAGPIGIARKKLSDLSETERSKLDGYYVRIRYNDEVVTVPGCRPQGKHLDGDQSFCTLAEFKNIVDKFTPAHWKKDCLSNLDAPAFPKIKEPAGY